MGGGAGGGEGAGLGRDSLDRATMAMEAESSGASSGAGGSGARTDLGGSPAVSGEEGDMGDSWRDSRSGSLSPNGGFGNGEAAGLSGFGTAKGDSIQEGDGAWPCSRNTRQDSTLGGTIDRVGEDLSNRQPGSRIPVYRGGPGATPPSLAKPISVYNRGTDSENKELAETSVGLSPVARGIFDSQQALPPPSGGSKVGDRRGGIHIKTPIPPTPRETEALFTSTHRLEFDHSSFYMEDDIPGNAGHVPANLALNNPVGRQPRELRPGELPWARDGWQMDTSGNLVAEWGERRRLDQYQRNFWRKREKKL